LLVKTPTTAAKDTDRPGTVSSAMPSSDKNVQECDAIKES
jgi:hypothetical protein